MDTAEYISTMDVTEDTPIIEEYSSTNHTEEEYPSSILVSPHTNKPLPTGTTSISSEAPVYWCEVCHVKLSGIRVAASHFHGKAHKNKLITVAGESDPNLKCETCDVQFRTLVNLETHLNGKKHASRKRALDECNALSTSKNDDAKNDPNFKCEICDIQFTSAITFETHMNGKKHTAKKRKLDDGNTLPAAKNVKEESDPKLKCEVCDIQFTSTSNLETHLNGKKHASRQRSLDKGNALSTAKNDEAEGDPNFKCEICDIQFSSAITLEIHLNGKKHTAKKRKLDEANTLPTAKNVEEESDSKLKCEVCDIQCTNTRSMEIHFNGKKHTAKKRKLDDGNTLPAAKIVKEESDPKLKCEVCDIQFTSASNLETHLNGKKHASRKRALDEGNALSTAKNGEAKGDPNWKCEICDIQFTSAITLETHMNGKKHASRKRALDQGDPLPRKKSKVKDEMKSDFKCEDCNIEFTNCDMAVKHFIGKKHKSQIIKNMQAKLPQKKSKTGWQGRGGAAGTRWSPNNYPAENARLVKNMQSLKPFGNGSMLSNYFTKAAGQQNDQSQPHTQRFEGGYRSGQLMQNSNGESNKAVKDEVYGREFVENIQSIMPNSHRSPGGNDYSDNGSGNNGLGNRGVGNNNNPNNYEYNGGGNFSHDRDERGANYRQTSRHREDGRDSDGNNWSEE